MSLFLNPTGHLVKFLGLNASLVLILILPAEIRAQVEEDTTTNTRVVTENNRDFIVDRGTQQGNNLFHSFSEFSVPTDGSLTFDNGVTIQNIITRVTGGNISNIDGLIKSQGSANLFLLNPNGIVWGENARLEIGGSLISTTAESLFFADGTEFSTDLTSSSSLLTVSVPLGLQYGRDPGSIINQANFSVVNEVIGKIKLGLSTTPGNTLALLGGGLEFAGGAISTGGGDIELGSVGANSLVILEPNPRGWDINYDQVNQFDDIQLNNLALVDSSGVGGGNIQVVGRNLEILAGSAISSSTVGNLDGGKVQVQMSEDILIKGSAPNGSKIDPITAASDIFLPFASQISSDVLGSGNGGDVEISAQSLSLEDGAGISMKILPNSTGNGGNLTLDIAGPISLSGVRPLIGLGDRVEELKVPQFSLETSVQFSQASEISMANIGIGQAGDINITADNVYLADAATITAIPIAQGTGGDINLDISGVLEVLGSSKLTPDAGSAISVTAFATGNAGNIRINTGQLRVLEGGAVISSTIGALGSEAVGDDVNNTNRIDVGDAGDLEINAEITEISGFSKDRSVFSQIGAQSVDGGAGGNVILNTSELILDNSAILSVEGVGQGQAGNLFVSADQVEINNGANIIASTQFQTGGNIELKVAENLILKNNGTISAQAFGDAQGGNIRIDSNFSVAFPQQNNDILATAVAGQGGNITVSGQGIFGLEERNSRPPNQTNDIDASSEFGSPGLVSLTFPDFNAIDNLSKLPLDFVDVNHLFKNSFCRVSKNSNFVITGRSGIPLAPENILMPDYTWTDWRISDDSSEGYGSEQQAFSRVESRTTPDTKVHKITPIQGWLVDPQGNVMLTEKPLVATSGKPHLHTPSCNQLHKYN
ncbi:MAG: filamentous hemagglutinin N-terminal domain-containing protein [Cyanobacteria bacterium J06600_6]